MGKLTISWRSFLATMTEYSARKGSFFSKMQLMGSLDAVACDEALKEA
jgi:hypothetical protein